MSDFDVQRFLPPGRGEPLLLLNPGPINVSQRVAEALLGGDLCHREPEYFAVQRRVRALLCEAFAPQGYAPILLTGSGTAALEASIASCVGPDERLLVLRNGIYGERIEQIAEAQGIEHTVLDAGWSDAHDVDLVRQALEEDPTIAVVAGVVHETTTGLLNPIQDLAPLCRELGRVFIVDAISAIGGEELDLLGWGVDVCVGSSNKCIRGLPGLSFVLATDAVMARIQDYPPRTLYLHLPTYYAQQEADGTPFTPAVQLAYAFQAALEELLEEGVAARVARMQHVSQLLRAGCQALGLELYLEEGPYSRTITTYKLPPGWSYERLHDALKARGFVIYAGQGALRSEAFRVCNMGVLSDADYQRFLAALGEVLAGGV